MRTDAGIFNARFLMVICRFITYYFRVLADFHPRTRVVHECVAIHIKLVSRVCTISKLFLTSDVNLGVVAQGTYGKWMKI
jgi:hypothetical protein